MMLATTRPTVEYDVEPDRIGAPAFVETAANSYIMKAGRDPVPHMPIVTVDPVFGGYDDPNVVSDDDDNRAASEGRQRCQQAIFSYFSKAMPLALATEPLVLSRERKNMFAQDYGWIFATLLGAGNAGAFVGSQLPATASLGLLDATKTSALFDRTAYHAIQSASHMRTMMNSYSATLEPIFASAGYSSSEAYEDGLGALVVDFIRSEDRVTLAIEENEAQLLYSKFGEFKTAEFPEPSASLLAVVEFVEKNIL